MTSKPQYHLFHLWLWPTLIALALTPFYSQLDIAISRFFYELYPGFQVPCFVRYLYRWGTVPALVIGISALVMLLINIRPVLQKYRTSALVALLTLLIGPGLIINVGLKGSFHRPRPVQIKEFGGKYDYVPITQMKIERDNQHLRSFPSGHTSMGFFFLALWRTAARERKRLMARFALITAFTATLFLSWARLAQGGHFFSDILFSGLITWLVIVALESYCYGKRVPPHE